MGHVVRACAPVLNRRLLLPEVTLTRLQQLQGGLPVASGEPLEDLLIHRRGGSRPPKSSLESLNPSVNRARSHSPIPMLQMKDSTACQTSQLAFEFRNGDS